MTAIKSNEAEAFVNRPNPAHPIVLVFGPDAGLVRERVERLIRNTVDDIADPFALARLEGDELSSDPTRLVEEAHTIPLFGGKRAVWVRAGSRNFAPAVEALIAAAPAECRVVIEAGDLRKSSPLRVICEKARVAASIGCYPDDAQGVARLIESEMRSAGLTIADDAKAALTTLLGGDRRATRSELEKLVLYAHGKDRIELEDVTAIVTDAATLTLDALVDATFAGRAAAVETQFARATAAGMGPGTVLSAALRHVSQLHRARCALDAGGRQDEALRSFVPPLHPRRATPIMNILSVWTSQRLERAMEQIGDAALEVRRLRAPADMLAEPIAQRALLAIAANVRRR